MVSAVLDSSAVVAFLKDEKGGDRAAALFDSAIIGAANAAEVVSILMREGMAARDARQALIALDIPIEPIDASVALRAGELVASTRATGLSLGDCLCLALAEARDAEAVTADKKWKDAELGVRINLIR